MPTRPWDIALAWIRAKLPGLLSLKVCAASTAPAAAAASWTWKGSLPHV